MTINAKRTQRQFMPRGFLANISLGWKMGLMVFVLFLGILGVSVSAYVGLQNLNYQLSNIYDFMLVPIVAINHADTALAEAVYQIENVDEGTEIGLEEGIKDIQANNKLANEVITRYDTEWVTTSSLEFTQALREGGKLALQEQEISALAGYHTAFNEYLASIDLYLATVQAENPDAALADETLDNLQVARAHLQELIDINNEYADFSNTLAHEAYRLALVTSGIVLAIVIAIGLFMSYLVALSITSRLDELTRSAEAMQGGNLDQTVAVQGRDEVSLLGTAFNNMASQLKELFATLEQRVADRTKAVATSAEVSRRLSTILNQKELVIEVVEQVQQAFGYYHAHIYLFNEAKDELLMMGGTGDAGAAMLADGHKIPKGRGLVGRAAEGNQAILVPDTLQDPTWLPNPLLPETKSEVAIPIAVGENVMGVLDVQHNVTGGLGQDDVASLQSIANQVAVALQNIASYERAEQSLKILRVNEAQLSDALNIARLAYWEYDAEKDLFTFNDQFYSIFHTSVEAVGGYQLSSREYAERFVHPEDAPLVGIEIGKSLASKEPYSHVQLEHRILFADGGIGHISVDVHVERDEGGRILRFYGANQDITERKNLELMALQRARQQEAINLITQKIQSSVTVEEALQVAARELGQTLGKRPTLVTLDPTAVAGE